MQALKHIDPIERNQDKVLELKVKDDTHIVGATPKAAYHAIQAVREVKCTVLEVTNQASGIPILLIEQPHPNSKLSKAAQDMGEMKHVSVHCGGEKAEVVWHVASETGARL